MNFDIFILFPFFNDIIVIRITELYSFINRKTHSALDTGFIKRFNKIILSTYV